MDALQLLVEPLDGHGPCRIVLYVGHVATAPPLELILQDLEEASRSTAERENPARRSGRLGSDRDRCRARRLRYTQQRVAAGKAAERPELVSCHENERRADPTPPQVGENPTGGIGLVGEADLHVLCVARHARVGKPRFTSGAATQFDRLPEPAQPCPAQSLFDRVEKLGDSRLRRIEPLRQRNEVDLSTVEALRHDLGLETSLSERRHHSFGGGVEHGILFGRRLPPLDEVHAVAVGAEDLRPAVHAQVEPPRARGASTELPVDVADVRARDHGKLEAERAQLLHKRTERGCIGLPIGDCRPVPVEDDRLEAAIERSRELCPTPTSLGGSGDAH
jgi:hypothetical protein